VRQRCYQCFRPQSHCFCEAIPKINNRTNVLILQHVGERSHAFNTARIVQQSLQNCQLFADHNQRFGRRQLPIHAKAGLLYPGKDAPRLTELPASQRPDQLVIIDGTWHQAQTIVRDVPQLRELPCYRLSPTSPGQYRIRREPDAQSLSTLEATVAALRALEPATDGLDQLLSAFDVMVETQLKQLARHAVSRTRKPRQSRPRNLPFTLLQAPERLVVAYGEATPAAQEEPAARPRPVNWLAHRLGSSERFACQLSPAQSLPADIRQHMRLDDGDFGPPIGDGEFQRRWRQFLRPHDVLVVYHQRTCRLLGHVDMAPARYLVLKSIFGNWRSGVQSMEELMVAEGLPIPNRRQSRASQRLAMAVAMVEHLRTRYGNLSPTL